MIMPIPDLAHRLASTLTSPDPAAGMEEVALELKSSGAGLGAVPTILRFIEEHPDVDFGAPGPLVHFVERFYAKGYEAELLASLARHPVPHTVWMLNRVINGTKKPKEREALVAQLRAVGAHPKANAETKKRAKEFVERIDE